MRDDRTYPGIDNDTYAGMTPNGNIIRDAWVFGIIPETERCIGWTRDQIQMLYDKVSAAWEPYGHMVYALPPELSQRHRRIFDEAIASARQRGWEPDMEDD
jgi:hypothetical protein